MRHTLEAMVAAGHPPVAILLTHNETSTGVTNPIEALAAAARSAVPEILILVDGISGVGAVPFETDRWDIDVVVTGSQKAWMVPPGLAMVAVSPRAWAAAERARMPRFYFDLRAHLESGRKGETPWTPAVGICFGLDVALAALEAEGWDAVYARHRACGAAARAGFAALGFELLADPAHASNTVTAAWLPDGRRLARAQRRSQGAWPRPRRRAGQAERADPAHGPPWIGDRRGRAGRASPSSRPRRIDVGLPVARRGEALAVAARAAIDATTPVPA